MNGSYSSPERRVYGSRAKVSAIFVLIPAHRPHRVTWTAKGKPTVWLAVHFVGS